jgi:hypothetical protein
MREQHGFTYEEGPVRRADLGHQQIIRPGSQQRGTTTSATRTGRYPPVSPHRTGFHAGLHPEDAPYLTDEQQDAFEDEEQDDDAYAPVRPTTSVRRYDRPGLPARYAVYPEQVQHVSPRRTAAYQPPPPQDTRDDLPATRGRGKRSMHWLWYAGLGATIALLLWMGLAWLGAWWSSTQNDWTYTQAFRTFSVDQAVGHNHDSEAHPSHFIVQNDHGHVLIIELPAGDAHTPILYFGPLLLGDGQDKTPVTISFEQDGQSGRLDLVLHIQNQTYVFVNTGAKFLPPSEQ